MRSLNASRSTRLAYVLLSCATCANAWVSTSQALFGATIDGIYNESIGKDLGLPLNIARQQSLGYLWTLPSDPLETRGLGASITWAWDESLCARLLPQMKENFWGVSLVTCAAVKASMHRAFATWSVNHRHIKFTEVTDLCKKTGQLHENCTHAEIWVTFLRPATATASGLEVSNAQQTAPRNFPTDFRATNGLGRFRQVGPYTVARPVAEIQRATISFRTNDVCWYLDSEFCSAWHSFKNIGGPNPNVMYVVRKAAS